MTYDPVNWKNRVVERPRTYHIQNNPDGTVTLIPAPGQVYEEGTPVNAANLNKMEQGFIAHLADNEQQFLDVNLNIIDMAVELETLKGATLNGVTANIFIETFQNLNDINLTHGIYESENKRLVL